MLLARNLIRAAISTYFRGRRALPGLAGAFCVPRWWFGGRPRRRAVRRALWLGLRFTAEAAKGRSGCRWNPSRYIDDDVLGFMVAEAGKTEGNDAEGSEPRGKKTRVKGTAIKRRGALEVTRAISLTPFAGDITFNAKSGEKSSTSLYGAFGSQSGCAPAPRKPPGRRFPIGLLPLLRDRQT